MKKIMVICLAQLLLCSHLYAAQIPAGQDAGAAVKGYTEKKRKDDTLKRLTTPKTESPALNEKEIESLPGNAESIYIDKIIVQHGIPAEDYIKKEQLSSLIKYYTDKALTLQDMKALAAAITKKFTRKELKAYIPKQSFAGMVMYINLVSEKRHP